MDSQPGLDTTSSAGSKGRDSLRKRLTIGALLVLIFGAGYVLGEGDINFGKGLVAPAKLDYSSVNQLYDVLKKDYDGNLNNQELLDGLKTGLVNAAGDPYTEYLDAKEAKDFNDQLAGSFTGIGAELGIDETKNIIVVSPLSGYPAEKAGLRSKDIIAAIDGQPTTGMTISAAVRKIRGPADSKVTLTIIRGNQAPLEVTISRAKITVPSVDFKIDGEIGYLKISQFSSDTASLAKAAASEFKNKQVKAVILDLRGNPGGYLESAVDISSLWLDKGQVVVQQKRGNTVLGRETAKGVNILKGLPTAVLLNAGSASASEIVAGALSDSGSATLVGVKSFGKGSVQTVEKLPGGAELKVTIARWYTPKGKNIDKQGIEPDVNVEAKDTDSAGGNDSQKQRAYEIVRQKIR